MPKFPDNQGNRESLFSKIEELITSHRARSKCFALLIININQFRRFNVNHGCSVADSLLVTFATYLAEIARQQDYIARIGNAEFAMLLPAVHNEGHASLAAIKIIEKLKGPLIIDLKKFQITANIGIALFPDHAGDVESLVKNAELALSDARKGSQPYAIYSDPDQTIESCDWDIEAELQKAIEKNQFDLYFQPQAFLDSGQLFGAEALIRWNNGSKGFIRPDLFIPLAEESGQIIDITQWTLNSALWFRKSWPKEMALMNVAVNISTKMLSEPEFVKMVCNAVELYAVEYQRLTLEITESALVEDMAISISVLDELKSLGVNISIDDFGTGYSSMAYFRNIPANELKIDQSFIRYMLENQMDQHIVETIIRMARGFDLKVVAEGVEDQETFDALKRLQCDLVQGYHLARPMPGDIFLNWVDCYLASQSPIIDVCAESRA